MDFKESFKANLKNITEATFERAAIDLFNFQYANNPIYREYINLIKVKPSSVDTIKKIPFMPIDFFKKHQIKTGEWQEEVIFESSGTTNSVRSKHYIEDTGFYLSVARSFFESVYGKLTNWTILALLPSYLERNNSSLVYMVNHFIENSSRDSGFFLNNPGDLIEKVNELQKKKRPVIIIGVTFALLDLAETFEKDLSGVIVMETGGMKGRREEITQNEVHRILKSKFSLENVHSEYGMTELLSQAYSKKDGVLESPKWMKVLLRDVNDPFDLKTKKRTGGINIIDLANVHSCAFIETKDIGEILEENKFKILGRFDNSDIRGCNLLIH